MATTLPHDSAWKLVFSFPQMVTDLLLGFLPRAWTDELDLSTLEKAPTNFVSHNLRQRHGDTVWRLRYRNPAARPAWVYLVLEFQSGQDPDMAVRMLVYAALLRQESLRHAGELGPGRQAPEVLPLLIHNGSQRWRAPHTLSAPVRAVTAEFQPAMRYLPLDVGAFVADDLPFGNRVSRLFALENCPSLAELPPLWNALLELLRAPSDDALQDAFWQWLAGTVLPEIGRAVDSALLSKFKENREMLAEKIERWVEEGRKESRQEGRQQGRQEGIIQGIERGLTHERALLCRLTTRRFGAATAERLAGLLDAVSDPERLAEVGEYIVDCDTGSELLERASGG